MKKIIPPLIILFWLSTMFLLIQRHSTNSLLDIDTQSLLPESKERWMGIYLKGKKIGFASSKFYKELEGYVVDEEVRMRLNVFGTVQDIKSRTMVSLSPDLRIRSFKFRLNATQDLEVNGRIHNKTLILDIITEGNRSRQEIHLEEIPQMPITILPYLIKKGVKRGKRIELPVFDPSTLSMQKMYIEIIGREKIILNKQEIEAIKIKGDINGFELVMWVDEKGNELKEESPTGFTLITEPMEKAISLPSSGVADIIKQTSIPFNLELPEDISYLKVRIKGFDLKGFELSAGRQSLKGDVIEIVKEDLSVPKQLPYLPISDMKEFLKETPFIQAKNPEIMNLARSIIRGERNPLIAGRLLWEWVFRNIEKLPSITLPSAIDVLKTRRGDCNEHTVLYTALARSVGLPTKIDIGLVYKDGYFYYHAWPEIYVGKWIAIDPTLGQFPADATHIRLISGDIDKQIMLLRVINKISLEGIEYK
jgi:hypothetical protein